MKLSRSVVLLSAAVSSVGGFSVVNRPYARPAFPRARVMMAAESTESSDVVIESAMPSGDPYERIGITKDDMALGIDATEFLQWIGNKQELVEKFQRDNKGMDGEQAQAEVGKFMMDAEMVNAYIKFERGKVENPPDLRAEAEQNLSDPKTIATYAAWLAGGASFGYVRKNFVEPKFASGEWQELHIPLPGFDKAQETAEAAASVASVVHSFDASSIAESTHATIDCFSAMV